jgi:Mce-associated membrane protein
MSQVTSEARERALAEDAADGAAVLVTDAEERPDDGSAAEEAWAQAEATAPQPEDDEAAEPGKRRGRRRRRTAATEEDHSGRRSGATRPLATVLAVLLVLLLAGGAWLWFTRPATSSVRTGDYVAVLQAARSEIVDLTSFDYLTYDEDIAKVKRITTGDLQKEVVDQLNKTRSDVTNAQAVVSTEVIAAAVTQADDEHGTVVLFIQSTQKNNTVTQAQVLQYHVEAKLTKVDGRWLLSGITGRGDGNG